MENTKLKNRLEQFEKNIQTKKYTRKDLKFEGLLKIESARDLWDRSDEVVRKKMLAVIYITDYDRYIYLAYNNLPSSIRAKMEDMLKESLSGRERLKELHSKMMKKEYLVTLVFRDKRSAEEAAERLIRYGIRSVNKGRRENELTIDSSDEDEARSVISGGGITIINSLSLSSHSERIKEFYNKIMKEQEDPHSEHKKIAQEMKDAGKSKEDIISYLTGTGMSELQSLEIWNELTKTESFKKEQTLMEPNDANDRTPGFAMQDCINSITNVDNPAAVCQAIYQDWKDGKRDNPFPESLHKKLERLHNKIIPKGK